MKEQTLGAMIAALRKEQGMTQLALTQQLGVTDKAVSSYFFSTAGTDDGCTCEKNTARSG